MIFQVLKWRPRPKLLFSFGERPIYIVVRIFGSTCVTRKTEERPGGLFCFRGEEETTIVLRTHFSPSLRARRSGGTVELAPERTVPHTRGC